jgi:hypothetical protein
MALDIILQGKTGVAAEVGGTDFRALNIEETPIDVGLNGAFSVGLSSGIMAAGLAANAELVQFRWTDATRYALVRKIYFSSCVSTTFFAAGVPCTYDLVKCNTWTAAGSGGTRVAPTGILKKRSAMGASLILANDIGVSTTAGLTAGTKVLEGTPMNALVAPGPLATSPSGEIVPANTLFWQNEVDDGEHPLMLHQNEGFVIRAVQTPATGTWSFRCQIDWSEVDYY